VYIVLTFDDDGGLFVCASFYGTSMKCESSSYGMIVMGDIVVVEWCWCCGGSVADGE